MSVLGCEQVPFLEGFDGREPVAAGGAVVVEHIVAGGYLACDAVLFLFFEKNTHFVKS